MAEYRFEFKVLGEAVEFLELVLRNALAMGFTKRDVHLEVRAAGPGQALYVVVISHAPEGVGNRLLALARCPVYTSPAGWQPGEKLTVNEFLERVQLVAQPQMPAGRPLAVLLFGASDKAFRVRYNELLDIGCRGLQAGVVQGTVGSQAVSHVLMVDAPPATFWPPADWAAPADDHCRAIACYRLRPAADCRLYVQWEHEHPLRSVEELYDFHEPRLHAVFALAASATGPGAASSWVRIRQEDYAGIFSLPEQRLQLAPLADAEPCALQPAPAGHTLTFDFAVQPAARSTSTSLEALETQIAQHQRAIADLRRDYRGAHALRRQPIYLAYVFEQGLSTNPAEPPALSPTFARFLDQPYGQLQHMDYGFYEVAQPDGGRLGLHIVFDNRPESHTQLLTSLADEVYVQRAQWREWELNLFVRRGDDVRPRLDAAELEPLVRRLLWGPGQRGRVLLRARPRPAGDATNGHGWELLHVAETVALYSALAFRFLNDRFARPVLAYRLEVAPDLRDRLDKADVAVDEACTQLEGRILEAVQSRLQAAETRWKTADEHLEIARRRTEECEASATAVQAAIDAFPQTWVAFVETILTADQKLHAEKIATVETYRKAQAALVKLQADHQTALEGVRQQVEHDEQLVRQHRALYDHVEHDVQRLIGELGRSVNAFGRRQAEVLDLLGEQQRDAKAQAAAAQAQLAEAQSRKRDLDSELRRLHEIRDSLAREQADIERLRRQTEDSRRQNQAHRTRLDAEQQKLTDQRRSLEALHTEVVQLEARVTDQRLATEREQHTLTQQKLEATATLTRLDEQVRQARTALAEQERRRRELQETLQRLREEHRAVTEEAAGVGALQTQVAGEGRSLDDLMQRLEQQRQQLDQLRNQVTHKRADYEQREQRLREEHAAVDREAAQDRQTHEPRLQELAGAVQLVNQRRAVMRQLLEAAVALATEVEQLAPRGSAPELPDVKIRGTVPGDLLEQLRKHLLP